MPKVSVVKSELRIYRTLGQAKPEIQAQKPRNLVMNEKRLTYGRAVQYEEPQLQSMVAFFDPPENRKLPNVFPEKILSLGNTAFRAGLITEGVADAIGPWIVKLADQNKPPILCINSPGGEVDAGLRIREAIEKAKGRVLVTTISLGGVSSMAAFLAASGSQGYRYAFESANFMFHQPRYSEDVVEEAEDMEETMDDLLASTHELFTQLSGASGRSFEHIKKRIVGDKHYNAEEAVRAGFIDAVIKPLRYYGPANPWGLTLEFQKDPLLKPERKAIKRGKKIKTSGKPASIILEGPLDEMRSYEIIAGLVSQIALHPRRDVGLLIKDSPGGLTMEGAGVLDIMSILINANPDCGNVLTLGMGDSINGISALLLSGGIYGGRAISSSTKLVLEPVVVSVPSHTQASDGKYISQVGIDFKRLVFDRFARNSRLSHIEIAEEVRKAAADEEKEGREMSADEAFEEKFVDIVDRVIQE